MEIITNLIRKCVETKATDPEAFIIDELLKAKNSNVDRLKQRIEDLLEESSQLETKVAELKDILKESERLRSKMQDSSPLKAAEEIKIIKGETMVKTSIETRSKRGRPATKFTLIKKSESKTMPKTMELEKKDSELSVNSVQSSSVDDLQSEESQTDIAGRVFGRRKRKNTLAWSAFKAAEVDSDNESIK